MLLQPVDMPRPGPQDQAAAGPADMSTAGAAEAHPAPHAISPPVDGLVMIAVPGEHSRKPQLTQLLQAYLPEKACCLEVCHATQWLRKRYGWCAECTGANIFVFFSADVCSGADCWLDKLGQSGFAFSAEALI